MLAYTITARTQTHARTLRKRVTTPFRVVQITHTHTLNMGGFTTLWDQTKAANNTRALTSPRHRRRLTHDCDVRVSDGGGSSERLHGRARRARTELTLALRSGLPAPLDRLAGGGVPAELDCARIYEM